jgi:hypothetical protein
MKNLQKTVWTRPLCNLALALSAFLVALSPAQTNPQGWPSHAHDRQHSGISAVAAQPLHKIHWSTPVDLDPQISSGEILIHYGSSLVTPSNTVIVPVKTGLNRFRVEARNGADGSLLWKLDTTYSVPSAGFTPSFGPALAPGKVIIPNEGGTVLVRDDPDKIQGNLTHMVFHGRRNFVADPQPYISNVKINTPITVDSKGNIFFGFVVLGPTPIGLHSGLARIASDGTGSWTSAAFASNDPNITKVDMNCAPALSADERTLYVGVNSFDFGFGYLLALDSQTLQPISQVRLIDPSTGLDAEIPDEGSATPTVGPDGDVFFGVLENPFPGHNDRGWLLHFNADLSQVKTPGSIGWDDTASVVEASLVASYHGTSQYLLMTKYNNYASQGGDGVNKIAILDPNNSMPDPILGNSVMNEVLTIKGVTGIATSQTCPARSGSGASTRRPWIRLQSLYWPTAKMASFIGGISLPTVFRK